MTPRGPDAGGMRPSHAGRPSMVVVVDDEIDHAVIIAHVLARVAPDLPVEVMTDPYEIADRLVETAEGALVLLDRLLDGRESTVLAALLRAERPDLTVAILSASLSVADRDRMLRAGAHQALEKPSTLAGWTALLRGLLDTIARDGGAVA